MMKKVRSWLPALIWAGVIFLLSAFPDVALPGLFPEIDDKIFHWLVYAIFGILLLRATAGHAWASAHAGKWVAFMLGVLYALSDEYHQRFVPGRTADVFDLFADALGLLSAVLYVYFRESEDS